MRGPAVRHPSARARRAGRLPHGLRRPASTPCPPALCPPAFAKRLILALALSLPVLLLPGARARALSLEIHGPDGTPVLDAVVALYPEGADGGATRAERTQSPPPVATMDQVDLAFVPHVLPIRVGSTVEFPNSDQVRHSIYSFSAARTFEIKLYRGFEAPPLTFDRPGLVVLGCNIHDHMIGFVYVLETNHHGVSDERGRIEIPDPPPGRYRLELRHPRLEDGLVLERRLELPPSPPPIELVLDHLPPPRPARPEEDEDPLQSLFGGAP